jgi:hypothetical protein
MRKIITILFLASLFACSPRIKTTITQVRPPLDFHDDIIVLGVHDKVVPASAVQVGTIKIGDNGFSTNCGWDIVAAEIKVEARKAGGNLVKITEHKFPSGESSCHRVSAKIFYVENGNDMYALKQRQERLTDSTWNYAKLYTFRGMGPGFLIGYNLYLDDSLICRMKSNTTYEIKIPKEGVHTLWAGTETKAEVTIKIQHGREYYLRCAMGMGAFVGRPQLELIDISDAKSIYEAIKGD